MKKLLVMAAALCGAVCSEVGAATKTQFLMLPQRGYSRVNRMRIPDTAEKMTDSDAGCMIYDSVPRNKSLATGARVDMANGIIYVLELPMTGWGQNDSADKQTGFIYTYDSGWNKREETDSPFLTVTARGAGSDFLVTRDEKYIFFSVMEGTNAGKVLRYTRATGEWDDFAVFTSNADGLRGLAEDTKGNLFLVNRGSGYLYSFKKDHAGAPYSQDNYEVRSDANGFSAITSPSVAVYRPADNRLYVAGWTDVTWFDATTLRQGTAPVRVDGTSLVPGYTAGCLSGGDVFFGGGNGSMNAEILKLTDYQNLAAVNVSPWTSGWIAYDFADWRPAVSRTVHFGETNVLSCADVDLTGGALCGAVGVEGGALALPAAASAAALRDSSTMLLLSNAFTVAFWANVPSAASGTLFSNGDIAVTVDASGKAGLTFGATVIATTAGVADGFWHNFAFKRDKTALELWVDGVQAGTATIGGTDPVSQTASWSFGPCAGAFVDELRVYASALAMYSFRSMAAEYAPGTTPDTPAQPTAYAPLDAAIGSEIDHAYANLGFIGAPQLYKYSNKWYLAYAVGGETRIKASADSVSWSDFATLPATGVSLFTLRSGELAAIGQVSETAVTLWAYDFTAGKWNERYAYSGSTAFAIMPNTLVNVCNKWGVGVAVNGAPFSGTRSVGYLYFNNRNDSDRSQIVNAALYLMTVEESSNDYTFMPKYSTVKDVLPGVACVNRGQTLGGRTVFESIHPLADADRSDGRASAGLERYVIQGYHTYYDNQMQYDYSREHRFVALPGAGKGFSLFKDPTTGLYWALTTPVLKAAELVGGRPASTIRHRLGLYVSGDLGGWTPCGLVATTGTVDTFGYNAPFVVIDGDDLLVAFGVSCDDGAIAPAKTDRSNYLAVKRIANFRTTYVASRPVPKKSTVLYATGGRKQSTVYKHYLGEDGEWHADSLLTTKDGNVTPYDGENAPTFVDSIAVGRRGSVYVLNRGWHWEDADKKSLRVYRFDRRGTFVRLYKSADFNIAWETVRLALSPDESTLYIGAPSQIWKLDVASGTFSTFADNSGGQLGVAMAAKSLAVDAAGNVYVADNSQYGKVSRFFPNGTQDASFVLTKDDWASPNPFDWGAWGVAVDDANGKLYVGCRDGQVWKVDLATKATSRLCKALAGFSQLDGNANLDAACNSLAVLDGKLYLSSVYGWVHEVDTDTGVQTPVLNNSQSVGGIGVYKYEPRGIAILFR